LGLPRASEAALKCVTKAGNGYKRKKVHFEDPFTPDLHELLFQAVGRIQKLLKLRGQPLMPTERFRWKRQ